MVSVAAMNAQNPQPRRDSLETDQERMARFFNAKVKMFKEKLLMDDAQTEKFIPIYKEYMTEKYETFKNRPSKAERDELKDNESATKILTEDIEGKIEMLNIEKKYVGKFAEVLNDQQLMRLFKIENDMQRMVRKEAKHRCNEGQPGQPGLPGGQRGGHHGGRLDGAPGSGPCPEGGDQPAPCR